MIRRAVRRLLAASAIACVASTASAQPYAPAKDFVSPVRGTLVIPDTKLLPGVPFDMWVELRNQSDGSVGVGLCPRLIVRGPNGDTFEVGDSYSASYLIMAPGETKTVPFPVGRELGAAFFKDPRLAPPGDYELSMRMDYCFGSAMPQQNLLPPTFLGPVVTNKVTVERPEPTGSDAAVWHEMMIVSDGQWEPVNAWQHKGWHEVWSDVLTKYPDSSYVPYALVTNAGGETGMDYRKKVLDAINRFPNSPVADQLHYLAWQFDPSSDIGKNEWAILEKSKRPTTRKVFFPREFEEKKPCGAKDDCEK